MTKIVSKSKPDCKEEVVQTGSEFTVWFGRRFTDSPCGLVPRPRSCACSVACGEMSSLMCIGECDADLRQNNDRPSVSDFIDAFNRQPC